jgi:hypothetical protein
MPLIVPIPRGQNTAISPSLTVACLALLFTIGSFWWIQVRRGRLRGYTSHVYSGAFTTDKIVLVLPLVMHNPAPAPLVVTDLRLRVSRLQGRTDADATALPMNLRWIASHSFVYPKSDTRVYAAPFVVDGRKAIERFIEFQRDNPPTLLEDGPYDATVEVRVQPEGWRGRHRWRPLLSYRFNAQFAVKARANLIPRSNDPDLAGPAD